MKIRSKYLLFFVLVVFLVGGVLIFENLNRIKDHPKGNSEDEIGEVNSNENMDFDSILRSNGLKEEKGEYQLQPLPESPFSTIDDYSRNVPASATKDVESLAKYLDIITNTDLEKARAIYIWITEHVRYDDDAFNSKKNPNYTAAYVLQNRKAVCEAYSNLFLELGLEMGLEVDKLSGFSKGYGFAPGKKFTKSDHAWNAVEINGSWRIFDSTWGASFGKTVKGKLVSTKQFDEYWFNVDPYEAIFNHYSDDPAYNFMKASISLQKYEKMPNPTQAYFKLGFNGQEAFANSLSNPSLEFPTVFDVQTYIKLLSAPKLKHLKSNKSYFFDFYIPRGFEVAAIDANNNWTHFKKEKGKFSLRFSPKAKGNLSINVRHEGSGKGFSSILQYKVQL